ncbi:MAG: SRPBCC domain-containing protein [Candidatus Bathyarchaeia archaeon]
MKTKVKTVKQKVIIPASPKEVYEAYVDPKKQSKFTGRKATGKAVVGGKFTAMDGTIFGKYLELDDGKRVVQEWSHDYPNGSIPSRLELCFNKIPEGTELVMLLSGIPEEKADAMPEGWMKAYWDPMKKYFTDESKA